MSPSNILDRLFHRKPDIPDHPARQPDTQPDPVRNPFNQPTAQPVNFTGNEQSFPPYLRVACAQSVGCQRDHNEDSIFTLAISQTDAAIDSPLGLLIVADGMGGHEHGEQASRLAARVVGNHVIERLSQHWLTPHAASTVEKFQEILALGVREAHQAVLREVPGGGTTLSAVLILGKQMTIAHVGDTRVYALAPDGNVRILTRDHSLVKRLVEIGQITPAEAAVHPQRNVLYRALGQGDPFEVDLSTLPLPASGYLMLCSDGLWGLVPEEQISRFVREAPTLQDACQRLVDAANQAGGPDNISVILVAMPN